MAKNKKECYFCVNNLEVDYKDTRTLRKFTNFFMKILPGSRTGVCAWHQRKLSTAIKRSRVMALLATTHK
ncbi:MAG: 30S ribosomal protein S18 [Patescibacteria group bacterium]|jgi:small subunit ribosomal protein S18